MLQRLITSITQIKQVTGVELVLQGNQIRARCLSLSFSGGLITVECKWESEGLQELIDRLDRNVPIALLLNGKGILHKQVSLNSPEQEMDERLLASVLPTVKPVDFYVQRYQSGNAGFFSLARQEQVNSLLDALKKANIKVTFISLGPFAVAGICSFMYGSVDGCQNLDIEGHCIEIKDGGVVGYSSSEPQLLCDSKARIGDDEVEWKYVLAYAASFAALVGLPNGMFLKAEPVEEAIEEFRQQKLFKFAGAATITFFFLLLLGSFLAFSSLSEQHAALQTQLGYKRNSLNELTVLEHEAKEKRQFLEATGWLVGTRLSFYADRIAATVPEGVRLTELNLSPLDKKKSKLEGRQYFETGSVAVHGACRNPTVLNAWLKRLSELDWVERVDRQNYSYDKIAGEGKFEFYILIKGGE